MKLGFTREDFRVFRIEGFSARMSEIYARIRPRLLRLSDQLAPELGCKLQMEFFPHVAKHVRRSVNPPSESWAAFGPSPNGYKRYGYLALSISSIGIHARAVVKAEADARPEMADKIEEQTSQLQAALRGTKLGRYEHWEFDAMPQEVAADGRLFSDLSASLQKKTGGIDVGFGWPIEQALRLDRAEVLDAFRELEPLYRIIVGRNSFRC